MAARWSLEVYRLEIVLLSEVPSFQRERDRLRSMAIHDVIAKIYFRYLL